MRTSSRWSPNRVQSCCGAGSVVGRGKIPLGEQGRLPRVAGGGKEQGQFLADVVHNGQPVDQLAMLRLPLLFVLVVGRSEPALGECVALRCWADRGNRLRRLRSSGGKTHKLSGGDLDVLDGHAARGNKEAWAFGIVKDRQRRVVARPPREPLCRAGMKADVPARRQPLDAELAVDQLDFEHAIAPTGERGFRGTCEHQPSHIGNFDTRPAFGERHEPQRLGQGIRTVSHAQSAAPSRIDQHRSDRRLDRHHWRWRRRGRSRNSVLPDRSRWRIALSELRDRFRRRGEVGRRWTGLRSVRRRQHEAIHQRPVAIVILVARGGRLRISGDWRSRIVGLHSETEPPTNRAAQGHEEQSRRRRCEWQGGPAGHLACCRLWSLDE